ncbi:MAG: hypothetical protein EOO87_03315 [Pedobacter sp.]|nr:MAG: hypothetical protein EOO87_03315 [Pedobacter sp.]
MRTYIRSFYILLTFFCLVLPKKSIANYVGIAPKTTNYVGNINKNLMVVFSLTQSGNKIKGYYFYDKIGVNILLDGEVVNGTIVLLEISEQNKIVAKLMLKPAGDKLTGNWQNLSNKKSLPVYLEKTDKPIPQLPATVLGDYTVNNEEGCKLTLSVTKSNSGYHFYYKSAERKIKGRVTFSRSLTDNSVYINLDGIAWAEDSGDVATMDGEEDDSKDDDELPNVVQGLLTGKEIIIQNTGNAMNYYVKLSDCDQKYIHLKKWAPKK